MIYSTKARVRPCLHIDNLWWCIVKTTCRCAQGFTTAQSMDLIGAEELANERDTEIQKICESIEQLAIVFKELSVMVFEQGTIIDRIDYNLEQARIRGWCTPLYFSGIRDRVCSDGGGA